VLHVANGGAEEVTLELFSFTISFKRCLATTYQLQGPRNMTDMWRLS